MKGGLYEDWRKRESRSDVEESAAAASCLTAVSGAQRGKQPLAAAHRCRRCDRAAPGPPESGRVPAQPGYLRPKLSSYRLKPSGTSEGGCRRRGAAPQWISG